MEVYQLINTMKTYELYFIVAFIFYFISSFSRLIKYEQLNSSKLVNDVCQ